MVRTSLGVSAEATALYEQVLAVTELRDEAWLRPHTLWVLSIALWKRGELDQAAERLGQGLQVTRRSGDVLWSSWCLEALAWIAAGRGESHRAAVPRGAALPFEEAIAHAVDNAPRGASSVGAGAGVGSGADRTGTAELTTLTRREREICRLVAEGLGNKQIAAWLVIAPSTAESHVQNIMGKLGFAKRAQVAVRMAEGQGCPD